MNPQPRIPTSLAVAVAACLAALAVFVPAAPGAPSPGDPGSCRYPRGSHVLTGHWGGDGCR